VTHFIFDQFKEIPLPPEHEVMRSWKNSKPLVSVVCTTYNHALYVDDAIRGFLIQKTDFPFEIVVHDDVSTDNTRLIVERYAAEYPNIIKTVFQQQNQYSQGKMILVLASEYASGDFIAFCEGDDYWIDSTKLQNQVDALKRYPESEVCFHAAIKTVQEQPQKLLFCRRAEGEKIMDVRAVIKEGGSFMPTASMLIRRSFFDKITREDTTFYQRHLDAYFFQIFSSLSAGAVYVDKPMSVYRSFSQGSWTEMIFKDSAFYINWLSNHIVRLHEADEITQHVYSEDFNFAIKRSHLSALNNKGLDLTFRKNYYQRYRNELGSLGFFLWHFIFKFPAVHALFLRGRDVIDNKIKQRPI